MPLVLHLPGERGLPRVPDQVRTIDITPTILHFLDIAPGQELDGLSLLPLMRGGGESEPRLAYADALNLYDAHSPARKSLPSGHYDNLQPFLKKCFQHPRFDNLLLDGYGSDKYKKRIWHLSYHIDRRAAREIEEMCGGRSFSSIRMEAVQALEASTVLKERIRALKEKRRTQASTLKRKRTLESRLESHTQVWLDSARRRLLEELEENPARIEKILALHPESGFEWRLAKELIEEHKSLKEKFLDEAHEALENGRGGRCDFLLMKYEQSSAALKRFDRPDAPKESIDWKSFLYQEPPKVEKPAAAPPNDGE